MSRKRRCDTMPRLDARPIAEFIREQLQEHSTGDFAAMVGVPERTLYGLHTGERKSVQFDIADRIITRSVGPHLFNEMYPYTGKQ